MQRQPLIGMVDAGLAQEAIEDSDDLRIAHRPRIERRMPVQREMRAASADQIEGQELRPDLARKAQGDREIARWFERAAEGREPDLSVASFVFDDPRYRFTIRAS